MTSSGAGAHVAAVILAAGRSTRMRGRNKLLVDIDGVPMIHRVADVARAAALDPVVVVVGHEADAVAAALGGLGERIVYNDRYAEGMSTSVAAGIGALPPDVRGAVILLGDMPWVLPSDVAALVASFDPDGGCGICVPTRRGRRGNPLLWGARHFEALRSLEGDVGARHLLASHADDVCAVEMRGDGVLRDADTPDALATGV